MPVRLAFAESEPTGWVIFYVTSDCIFFIDIILTFMTAVPDKDDNEHVYDYKYIAKEYIKGWFWIDLIAILPIDYIMFHHNN